MSTEANTTPSGLRVVAYCVLPGAYQVIADWARAGGHKLLLLVTTPGPSSRRSDMYRGILAAAPPLQEILITTRMQRAVPLIAALAPDLVVSFTFPYRIPPEVTRIPKYGAVNLHPAPLPAYRGPNPMRAMYDGAAELGATLHRTAEDFDTGPILSRVTCPMPEDPTRDSIFSAWFGTVRTAFAAGIARAVAGDAGEPQDEAGASYGAPFTEAEHWLDWNLPARLLQCRVAGLSMLGPVAKAYLDGQEFTVLSVVRLPDAPPGVPGTTFAREGSDISVHVGDGALRVTVAGSP
jgi:methionyl-tRNA formyltransferase